MKKYSFNIAKKLSQKSLPPFFKNAKILITGITSIHGWPIFTLFHRNLPEENVFGIRSPKMTIPDQSNVSGFCITDRESLYAVKKRFNPTHIIYCSGVCDLDVCEIRPEWAKSINVGGIQAVSEVFGSDCHIMFISTDLVFSGYNPPWGGYSEREAPDPVSVVGKTFAQAEKKISRLSDYSLIRLGLPIGESITSSKGAVDFIENRFKKGLRVSLFYDELRSCIECDELALVIYWLVICEARGIYHLGGDKKESLYDLGKEIVKKGFYQDDLLEGKSFKEDICGPPRIGDVSLNTDKIRDFLEIFL